MKAEDLGDVLGEVLKLSESSTEVVILIIEDGELRLVTNRPPLDVLCIVSLAHRTFRKDLPAMKISAALAGFGDPVLN